MLFRYVRRNLGAEPDEAAALARELGVMPATAEILIGRGVATYEAGRAFFDPGMGSLRDPMGLAGMAEAAARIERAIASGERIAVYGDYDVDGVCATSILMEYLLGRGARCEYYIPSRHTEGYGLNTKAVESLSGVGLLVTVDCGVTNGAEVARARELGMDVVVSDHHECPDVLPDCTAVVNPKRPGQAYGFSGLCGAGVALKLVQALGGAADVERALDLAALATVADIVPLVDENRAIVAMGIERIRRDGRPGIQALKEAAGLAGKPIKAGNIAFMLAPRINAGGRMDLSRKSVELMLTEDLARAREIARELNDDNAERVRVEEGILEEACGIIENSYSFSRRRAIVLYQPHWNTGVTGIVASRIVERYHRPTFLFGDGEGACYGSGRSVPGVHLFQAMKACADWFIRFGGHEQAAGCAMLPAHIELFAAALDKHLMETCAEDVFLPLRHYDAALSLPEITMDLARDMDRLEPCGFGNPRPVFLLRDAELAGLSRTADGKHLRMRFGGGVEGIAFRQGGLYEQLAGARACDALVVPDVNEWMGRARVQAVVEHIRPQQGANWAQGVLKRAGAELRRLPPDAPGPGDGQQPAGMLGWQAGMDLFLVAVRRSCWGTLALCFTETSAAGVLRALEESGCTGRVYAGLGAAHQAARRENALVVAPDPAQIPVEGYDAVFLFDGLLAASAGRQITPRLNNTANCIIIDGDSAGFARSHYTREALLVVHRAMKAQLAAKVCPTGPADWAWLTQDGISPWRAEVSARIFIELGLFDPLDKAPWLRPAALAGRADLGGSATYRLLSAALGRVENESEGQGARDTRLPDAGHTVPGHHDAAEGRRSLRGAAGQDA